MLFIVALRGHCVNYFELSGFLCYHFTQLYIENNEDLNQAYHIMTLFVFSQNLHPMLYRIKKLFVLTNVKHC